jgi:hypothetical protein
MTNLNLRGHDTTWADFGILDVMSIRLFDTKRIADIRATVDPTSDIVLMAV